MPTSQSACRSDINLGFFWDRFHQVSSLLLPQDFEDTLDAWMAEFHTLLTFDAAVSGPAMQLVLLPSHIFLMSTIQVTWGLAAACLVWGRMIVTA